MYLILLVLHQILRPKASLLQLQKRDEQNTCLKPKKKEALAGTGRWKTIVAGKENAIGRIAVSQKCDGRDLLTVGMVKDQKRTQHKVPQRLGGRSVVSSKVKRLLVSISNNSCSFIDVRM